jgi:hypothetical protein
MFIVYKLLETETLLYSVCTASTALSRHISIPLELQEYLLPENLHLCEIAK